MRKRYRLLLIIVISFILVFFIYFKLKRDKFIYLSFASAQKSITYEYEDYINEKLKNKNYLYYKYNNNVANMDLLLIKLNNNDRNINYYIKNAGFITFYINIRELNNYKNLTDDIIEDYLHNFKEILMHFNKLNNQPILVINLYTQQKFKDINIKIKQIVDEMEFIYIDESFFEPNELIEYNDENHLTYKGHNHLANYIINYIKNNLNYR